MRSDFTVDGEYLTKELAEAIYNVIIDVIDGIANDFFIAGVDYDWRLSNPSQAAYIASFFEREDAILSSDIVGDDWKKLYSPTHGLGRINRNFEGIPTATFWELDFTDAVRDVVYYELDDGSDIFLRVPVEWWENYELTTLGNDRTDPDRKTLQYVGNTDTVDETVGYTREVYQLDYTQGWSDYQREDEPQNPSPGDWWRTEDYDGSNDPRYVVTYRSTPHASWTDPYTAYQQYSIFDGREISPAEPYTNLMYYFGLVELAFAGMGTLASDTLGIDAVYLDDFALTDDLVYSTVEVDRSVKVEITPKEWDVGDAGQIPQMSPSADVAQESGTLFYLDNEGVLHQTDWGEFDMDKATVVSDSDGYTVFTGNNWDFGYDNLGHAVFGQFNAGSADRVLAVDQDGVQLEQLAVEQTRWVPAVGRHQVLSYPSYWYDFSQSYSWQEAFDNTPTGYHMVIINNQAENDMIADDTGDYSVWLGGHNVYGWTHDTWTSFDWVSPGGHVHRGDGQYTNFAPGEPNDLNGENELMMWPDGYWNDLDGNEYALSAVYEKEPHWLYPEVNGETFTDYIYKMKTKWEPIEDIRSNITYRIFTECTISWTNGPGTRRAPAKCR